MKEHIREFWRSLKLRQRVIITINLTIVVVLLIVSIFAVINRIETQKNEANQRIETEFDNFFTILNFFKHAKDSLELKKWVKAKTIYENGYISVVDQNGNVLLTGNQDGQKNISKNSYFKEILKNESGLIKLYNEEDGENYYIYYKKPDNASYSVLITVFEKDIISAQVNNTIKILLLALIFSMILMTIVNYLIIKTITDPLNKISEVVTKLSKGQIAEQIEYSRKDEIGSIIDSINVLASGLKETALFAKEIEKGNFDYNYTPLSKADVLGNSLLDMRLSLLKASEEEKIRKIEDEKRNWASQGLAKFADILRKDNDNIELLCYNVIYNLVKYINATLGGIFILEDEDKTDIHLHLKACYAYDRQKFMDKRVEIGEGLVGSCYLEKKSAYLDNIPEKYLDITSGLGESRPRYLLITPLILNNVVYGVIEIASLKEIEPHVIEFVERIAESIASTISSVKINVRTAILLEQSQLQGEQMKAQEEEMRQNLEELHATQESMSEKARLQARELEEMKAKHEKEIIVLQQKIDEYIKEVTSLSLSEERYKKQIEEIIAHKEEIAAREAEAKEEIEKLNNDLQQATEKLQNQEDLIQQYIEQINQSKEEISRKINDFDGFLHAIDNSIALAEFDLRGNIISANENYAKIIGIPKNEIIGKNYIDLFVREGASSSEFIMFFDNLSKGLMQSGENVHKFAKGEVWLNETYTPVKNQRGEVFKVISFIQDITERKKTESIQNVIFSILSNVNEAETLYDLFYLIQINLNQIIFAKNFFVAVYNNTDKMIYYPYYADEKGNAAPNPHLAKKGLVEYVYQQRKPMLVTPRRWQELTLLGEIEREGTPPVDWLGVPMIYDNQIIGIIVLQSFNDKVRLKESDKNFVFFIAEQVAHAVRKRLDDALGFEIDLTEPVLPVKTDENLKDSNLIVEDKKVPEKQKTKTDDNIISNQSDKNEIVNNQEQNNSNENSNQAEKSENEQDDTYDQNAWNEHLDASGKLFKKNKKRK